METIKVTDRLSERLRWLIKLRWIAVAGVFLTIFFVARIFKLPLNVFPIYILTFILALCNLTYLIFLKMLNRRAPRNLSIINNRVANLQIFLDLTFLAALLHFSGGIENPFIFYFIFHMIIASILLTRRASFLQASSAVFLFSLVVLLEYFMILPHYCLEGFILSSLHNNFLYISGVSFVFISTLYISVYMATSISGRLREREESLEKANLLLKEKDRIKSEYVLRVSHDIKEHLSAIESCIAPVTKLITGPLNERQSNLLSRAKERAQRLLSFVRALLEVTRIKLHKGLKIKFFSFPETMKGILEDINLRAKAKGISFNVDIDRSIKGIKGIRVYIEEAILNLLVNSLKYTPAGGEIFFTAKDKEKFILIQVKDTGIGIPREELSYIFDEFYRASNAKKIEKMGTGLGLSIVKEIVELHKGKIWAESKEEIGAIFYIELPK